ncbi:MAG: GDSL-type esterase/lipase family protein [candidate division KSB1 bacterium]|nr:GDSL-type esterase/lipase family protein [candidate division KSB1 bacterium]
MRTVVTLCVAFAVLSPVLYAQREPIRIACIGNSITQGYGQTNIRSYPNQLDTLLGSAYDVRNFGVGGTTMLRKGDLPYWNQPQFVEAKRFLPHVVIILLGTNDSKPWNWQYRDEFFDDYADMVRELRALDSRPRIYVGFPPPVFQDGFGIRNAVIRDEIIPLIDSVRVSLKTLLIDFYSRMQGMGDLFPDGIHPNAEGYRQMALIAAEAILNPPPGVIEYFYADAPVLEEGQATWLHWKTSAGSQVTLNGKPVPEADSLAISLSRTEAFRLMAWGPDYQDSAEVTVQFLPSGTIKFFRAEPPVLELGSDESSVLRWSTSANSRAFLDGVPVEPTDSLVVRPEQTTRYRLVATGAVSDTAVVTVELREAAEINRARIAAGYQASSTAYGSDLARAFDGSEETYWQSERSGTQWVLVDLGREILLQRVVVRWGEVYGKLFHVQGMDASGAQGSFATSVVSQGGVDDLVRSPLRCRYVRLLIVQSSNPQLGYQIRELELYGTSRGLTAVSAQESEGTAAGPVLLPLSPNPTNSGAELLYHLPRADRVKVALYSARGRLVRLFLDQPQAAGWHRLRLELGGVPSGLYLCRLEAAGQARVQKLVVLR